MPWDFVHHRPQHLMTRFASHFKIIFIEPARYGPSEASCSTNEPIANITTVKFNLPDGVSEAEEERTKRQHFARVINDLNIKQYIFWFYTPEAVMLTAGFNPLLTVYDCMTEFPSPHHTASDFRDKEIMLLQQADLIFTAGPSLFEAMKHFNPNTYCLSSSVDIDHFFGARYYTADPADQAEIAHPRIGFSGIIDDRIDLTLLKSIALRRPDWNLILLGPMVGISDKDVPKLPNLHFLGAKSYDQLPEYISGWDIAMLPFTHTDHTRYMNPMQTPEFLAAGKPVIATPVIDVIRSYGNRKLVQIAGTAEEFVRVATLHLTTRDKTEWLQNVADFLSLNSWDKTWQRMMDLTWTRLLEKNRQPVVKHGDKIYA